MRGGGERRARGKWEKGEGKKETEWEKRMKVRERRGTRVDRRKKGR